MTSRKDLHGVYRSRLIAGSGGNYVFCSAFGHHVHLDVCRIRRKRVCNRCRYGTGQLCLFDREDRTRKGVKAESDPL